MRLNQLVIQESKFRILMTTNIYHDFLKII